jgi:hypothetical protein
MRVRYPAASDREPEQNADQNKGELDLTRIRARVAIIALIAVLPAALAGCFGGDGGGGGSEDPNQVLDQTFNNPTKVSSGNLDISLNATAEGNQSGNLTATIDGPFQGDANNPTTFPQLDLTAKISASGAGQSFNFDGGLTATKDNAYVEYQGQAYEVGSSIFQQFKTSYEQSAKKAQSGQGNQKSSFFEQFGIDPKTWLTNVSNEGDESVDGQDTIHIHGDANIDQIFSDLSKIAQQTQGGTAQALSPAQLDQVKSAIQDASVDVYSGTDDHLLRKLSLSLSIAPPASSGVSSVKVDFSVTLSDVNQAQTIAAPSGAKPISGLLSQLGISGLGPLGSLQGGTSGSGGSVGGGGGPSQAYLKCVQQASPSQIGKCASKL